MLGVAKCTASAASMIFALALGVVLEGL